MLGKDVMQVKADSGDGTPKIAPGSVDKLLNANVDTIIGAASSSVSLSVIDKIINAGVVQFSPANTSTAFDTYDDKGMYFRTAPSDVLQGNVLGNLVLQDGAKNVAIMARQDSYGEALAENTEKTIKDQGGNVVGQGALQRRRHVVHVRGREDQGRQARCHRADRVQRDHEDHPASSSRRHRPSGRPDLLRRRQHRRLQQGLPEGHARGHQGHVPGCGAQGRLPASGCSRSTRSSRTSPMVRRATTRRSCRRWRPRLPRTTPARPSRPS